MKNVCFCGHKICYQMVLVPCGGTLDFHSDGSGLDSSGQCTDFPAQRMNHIHLYQ